MSIWLFPLVLIIFGAIFFFYSAEKRNRKVVILWLISLFLSILCIGLLTWFYNIDAPSIERGEQKALPILIAIEKYETENEEFPSSLDILIPDYLPKIPEASWRHDFCYDLREDGGSFTLAFVPQNEAIGDGWDVYSSLLKTWTRTDSGFYQPCHFSFDFHLLSP